MSKTVAQRAAAAALDAALERQRPACHNDSRFIADHPPADELKRICRACPVRAPCQQYADTTSPDAGFWAGSQRGAIPRKTTTREKASTNARPTE